MILDKKEDTVRKRKSNEVSDDNDTKHITFEVEEIDNIVTDFNKDGSFQKTVEFSFDQTFLATGGADGFLRVWKVSRTGRINMFLNSIKPAFTFKIFEL